MEFNPLPAHVISSFAKSIDIFKWKMIWEECIHFQRDKAEHIRQAEILFCDQHGCKAPSAAMWFPAMPLFDFSNESFSILMMYYNFWFFKRWLLL